MEKRGLLVYEDGDGVGSDLARSQTGTGSGIEEKNGKLEAGTIITPAKTASGVL